MNKFKWKKWLLIATGSFLVLALLYVIFISYLVTNGFRDYMTFCSRYMPLLEEYRAKNSKYPKNLSEFRKPDFYPRYDAAICGYSRLDNGYMFYMPEGLIGTAIYNSNEGKWFHD